ncbi:hypothetical protein BCR42DRAFT_447904 [Absidia repens]|uniref:Uncharacterized protein n=1 Tax=Absidia repens TaxID=90262 RepID=A0A1X2IV15_9FUNG|nr:hypothetical protein BCR42DRAFT_447904 [Absidia repens]
MKPSKRRALPIIYNNKTTIQVVAEKTGRGDQENQRKLGKPTTALQQPSINRNFVEVVDALVSCSYGKRSGRSDYKDKLLKVSSKTLKTILLPDLSMEDVEAMNIASDRCWQMNYWTYQASCNSICDRELLTTPGLSTTHSLSTTISGPSSAPVSTATATTPQIELSLYTLNKSTLQHIQLTRLL